MTKKNLKSGWKSTLTGIIVLLVTLLYMLIAEPINFYVFATGLIFGVLLLFSPDTLINKIELILGKIFSKKQENE